MGYKKGWLIQESALYHYPGFKILEGSRCYLGQGAALIDMFYPAGRDDLGRTHGPACLGSRIVR